MRTFKHLFLVFIISCGFFTTDQPQEPVYAICNEVTSSRLRTNFDETQYFHLFHTGPITTITIQLANGEILFNNIDFTFTTVSATKTRIDVDMPYTYSYSRVERANVEIGSGCWTSLLILHPDTSPDDPGNGG